VSIQQVILLALQVSILSTVFGFGLKATVDDLFYLWRRPGLLLRSLVAMYLAMPLVALVLVGTLDLPLGVKIVLVALSIAPLPPVLPNKLAKTGERGDYAIALMATLALLSIGITPLAVALLGRYFDHPFAMSAATVAKTVCISIVVPLLLGMAARAIQPRVERLAGAVLAFGKVLLIVAALALVVDIAARLWSVVGVLTVAAIVAFVAAGLAIGHLLGGPDRHGRVTLAYSSASRHPTIALAIATATYPDERVGATIVLYLLLGALVCLPYTRWQKRKHSAEAAFA
jgi:BASS family bile acid:Na+ symporter